MHYLSNAQFITENASPLPPQEKEKKGGGAGQGGGVVQDWGLSDSNV